MRTGRVSNRIIYSQRFLTAFVDPVILLLLLLLNLEEELNSLERMRARQLDSFELLRAALVDEVTSLFNLHELQVFLLSFRLFLSANRTHLWLNHLPLLTSSFILMLGEVPWE